VAIELTWTGTLLVPVLAWRTEAGQVLEAEIAMFLELKDGKIIAQRNYDCYAPF